MAPPTQALTVQQQQQQRLNLFRRHLEASKRALELVLPKHLDATRICRIVLGAISSNPRLAECRPNSVILAVMQACQLGLEPGSVSGEAYLVPYKGECKLIPGYRGLMKLARNTGEVLVIEADVVYAGDEFKFSRGIVPVLEHTPFFLLGRSGNRGQVVAAYAMARLRSGMTHIDVMSREDIDLVRKRSRSSEDGPWVTDFAEMAKKTVVRRLCKYLPMSASLSGALELDRREEGHEPEYSEDLDMQEPTEPERMTAPQITASAGPSSSGQANGQTGSVATLQPGQSISGGGIIEGSAAPAKQPAPRRSDPPPDQPNPKVEEIRKQMEVAAEKAPPAAPEPSFTEPKPNSPADVGFSAPLPTERALKLDQLLDNAKNREDLKTARVWYIGAWDEARAAAKSPEEIRALEIEKKASQQNYDSRWKELGKAAPATTPATAYDGLKPTPPAAPAEREPGSDDE